MPTEPATTPAAAGTALLDRDREVTALDDLAGEACAGRGRIVLIQGRAGIGKSGLLAGLRDRAAPAASVLAARASELERESAFGVVRQLYRKLGVRSRRELPGALAAP